MVKKPYMAVMRGRMVRDILNAYHKAALGDLLPAHEAAEALIAEVIRDCHLHVGLNVSAAMTEAFSEVAEIEVED